MHIFKSLNLSDLSFLCILEYFELDILMVVRYIIIYVRDFFQYFYKLINIYLFYFKRAGLRKHQISTLSQITGSNQQPLTWAMRWSDADTCLAKSPIIIRCRRPGHRERFCRARSLAARSRSPDIRARSPDAHAPWHRSRSPSAQPRRPSSPQSWAGVVCHSSLRPAVQPDTSPTYL